LTCLVLQSSTVSAGTVLHQHPIASHCQAPQAARVYPNEFTSIKEGDTMVIAEGSAPNFVAHFVPFINLTPSVNQNLFFFTQSPGVHRLSVTQGFGARRSDGQPGFGPLPAARIRGAEAEEATAKGVA